MRVGLFGCGFIANVHGWGLWALRKAGLRDVRVVAVCDSEADRASRFAEPLGAKACDREELLGSVDIVYVCTPTAEHASLVEAAADRGLPVFCEKPLAPTLSEAERVAAALERVPHQVGLVLRAAPVFAAMREAVSSRRHGRPLVLTLRDDQFFPIQGHYASAWRSDPAMAGGGTLIEHSIHDLDLFRVLLGDPCEISCRTSSSFGYEGIEDLAVVTLTFADGVVANLVSVWHQILSRPSTRRTEIFFEDALLWTEDDNTGPLHVQTTQGEELMDCAPPPWVDELPVPEEVRRGPPRPLLRIASSMPPTGRHRAGARPSRFDPAAPPSQDVLGLTASQREQRMVVREARPEELEEVGRLTLEAYLQYRDNFNEQYWTPYSIELQNARARAEAGTVVVAEVDGQIVGSAALRPDAWEEDTVYLQMVAVSADARRAGIGRAIMDHAFEYARARGAKVLKWNTVSFMHPAREMYSRLGYEPAQEDALGDGSSLFTYRVKV